MNPLEQEMRDFLTDLGIESSEINNDLKLIGDDASIKSRDLVELLLIIEDFLDEKHGIEFDWSSSNAMSNASSNYRTLGSLLGCIEDIIKNSG